MHVLRSSWISCHKKINHGLRCELGLIYVSKYIMGFSINYPLKSTKIYCLCKTWCRYETDVIYLVDDNRLCWYQSILAKLHTHITHREFRMTSILTTSCNYCCQQLWIAPGILDGCCYHNSYISNDEKFEMKYPNEFRIYSDNDVVHQGTYMSHIFRTAISNYWQWHKNHFVKCVWRRIWSSYSHKWSSYSHKAYSHKWSSYSHKALTLTNEALTLTNANCTLKV